MFKLKKIKLHNMYYSDLIKTEHFFTTRDLIVKENLDLIAQYLKIAPNKIIKPHQTHSDIVKIVTDEKDDYSNCDALILTKKDFAIYLNFADCTPVILYDEIENIAAIAHAGWRGTAAKIVQKTVLKMNTNPKNIKAAIGPCISFSQFETYDEALNQLKASIKDKTGLFKDNYADLKGINKRQLIEAGLQPENIDVCPYCTVLDNDKFFSYRKENKTKNRHSAFIKLSL